MKKMNQKGCPTIHNAVPKQIRKRLARAKGAQSYSNT
jgi:hypothetical protein